MFLTEQEIIDLTGRKRHNAQRSALNAMGITSKVRADGSLVVLSAHVHKELGGSETSQTTPKQAEPNWGAL